jgi:hypothetical protein
MKSVMRAAASALAAGLMLAGCGEGRGISHVDVPIKERWAVPENASPECLSAAKRASKFCLDKSVPSDIWGSYTSECTRAQWDHARNCN